MDMEILFLLLFGIILIVYGAYELRSHTQKRERLLSEGYEVIATMGLSESKVDSKINIMQVIFLNYSI